jgi:hypothetical protein
VLTPRVEPISRVEEWVNTKSGAHHDQVAVPLRRDVLTVENQAIRNLIAQTWQRTRAWIRPDMSCP